MEYKNLNALPRLMKKLPFSLIKPLVNHINQVLDIFYNYQSVSKFQKRNIEFYLNRMEISPTIIAKQLEQEPFIIKDQQYKNQRLNVSQLINYPLQEVKEAENLLKQNKPSQLCQKKMINNQIKNQHTNNLFNQNKLTKQKNNNIPQKKNIKKMELDPQPAHQIIFEENDFPQLEQGHNNQQFIPIVTKQKQVEKTLEEKKELIEANERAKKDKENQLKIKIPNKEQSQQSIPPKQEIQEEIKTTGKEIQLQNLPEEKKQNQAQPKTPINNNQIITTQERIELISLNTQQKENSDEIQQLSNKVTSQQQLLKGNQNDVSESKQQNQYSRQEYQSLLSDFEEKNQEKPIQLPRQQQQDPQQTNNNENIKLSQEQKAKFALTNELNRLQKLCNEKKTVTTKPLITITPTNGNYSEQFMKQKLFFEKLCTYRDEEEKVQQLIYVDNQGKETTSTAKILKLEIPYKEIEEEFNQLANEIESYMIQIGRMTFLYSDNITPQMEKNMIDRIQLTLQTKRNLQLKFKQFPILTIETAINLKAQYYNQLQELIKHGLDKKKVETSRIKSLQLRKEAEELLYQLPFDKVEIDRNENTSLHIQLMYRQFLERKLPKELPDQEVMTKDKKSKINLRNLDLALTQYMNIVANKFFRIELFRDQYIRMQTLRRFKEKYSIINFNIIQQYNKLEIIPDECIEKEIKIYKELLSSVDIVDFMLQYAHEKIPIEVIQQWVIDEE